MGSKLPKMSTQKQRSKKNPEQEFSKVIRAKCRPSLKKRLVKLADKREAMEAELVRQAVLEYLEREESKIRCQNQPAESSEIKGVQLVDLDPPDVNLGKTTEVESPQPSTRTPSRKRQHG
jgi:hypothetical protein